MMDQTWNDIIRQFGRDVVLYRDGTGVRTRALVQPCLDQGREQEVPGPLGLGRKDRFRYMGPARHPLDMDTLVEWDGQAYRVQSAHLVGEGVCPHWWAMLCPRDEVRV